MAQNIRTIKNVPHDLKPTVYDMRDLLSLPIKSSSDVVKIMKELQKQVFLLETYLQKLDAEADANGIEKAIIRAT